jgi:predicted aspartyl protease
VSAVHQISFPVLPDDIKSKIRSALNNHDSATYWDVTRTPAYYLNMVSIVVGAGIFMWWLGSIDFGELRQDGGWQGWGFLTGYCLGAGVVGHAVFSIWKRRRLCKLFGFTPGRYWLSYSIVDARGAVLKVYDLAQLANVNVTVHTTNGAYKKTAFTLSFQGVRSITFDVSNKSVANGLVERWDRLKSATQSAAQRSDLVLLESLDPFWPLRSNEWEVPIREGSEAPASSLKRFVTTYAGLVTVAIAAIFAVPIWIGRNVASDNVMYREARRLHTEAAYTSYIDKGWLHVDDMRDARPRVAFEEQKKHASVTGLGDVLKRYPNAGLDNDVAMEIHTLYQASLRRFAASATNADPSLLPLVSAMLDYLEATGIPIVELHFSRPSTIELKELDARIAAKGGTYEGRSVAPASMHFAEANAVGREARIISEIQHGFGAIFPNDVLSIRPVQVTSGSRPLIDVKYEIAPSGDVYVPENERTKSFVGLEFRFAATMSVPNRKDHWRFGLDVQPPKHFIVDYQRTRNEPDVGPADSLVYSVMASRAFDELNHKLRAAFFRTSVEEATSQLAASGRRSGPENSSAVRLMKEDGTYVVPVLINNAITLNFIIDSGASDVSIPADVVLTLIRTGTLRQTDFLGTKIYTLADGSQFPSRTFRIRSMKVGDRVVENITGSVAPVEGSLLLGQSFLGRFKSWSIDNSIHTLLLK